MTIQKFILIVAWATVAFIVFATLSPINERPHLTSNPDIERFAAFAVAALFLALSYPRRFLWIVLLMASLSVVLEGLQRLTPDRDASLNDMAVKAVGGLCGVFVAGLIERFRRSNL